MGEAERLLCLSRIAVVVRLSRTGIVQLVVETGVWMWIAQIVEVLERFLDREQAWKSHQKPLLVAKDPYRARQLTIPP